MFNAHSKRQKDIKSKLMAAICMLLVSSIMMVSTTYAWFTLSTAPEVTGINTAVGANGNLEMALLPTSGNVADIKSDVGDSMSVKDATLSNVTWGNLVDLSNPAYGLQKIKLYPSALNVPEDAPNTLNPASLLTTPVYGADGRVSDLKANTVTSIYKDNAFAKRATTEYGVRAVGSASGMTEREMAYRDARSAGSTSMVLAKNLASTSLEANGEALANIAVAHAANASATHTKADVAALLAITNDLLGTDSTTGVLDHIEDAYAQYIIAYLASAAAQTAGLSDEAFKVFSDTVATDDSLAGVQAALATASASLPAEFATYIDELADTRATVETANSSLATLYAGLADDATVTWSQISDPLHLLADTNAMTVNGLAMDQLKTDAGIQHIIETIGGGLNVTMSTGGGVYADVADHCGNFNASIEVRNLKYGSVTVARMDARMTTEGAEPNYLSVVDGAVTRAGAPEASDTSTEEMPISEFYGYVLDLAFRTNAAESNLLLQAEGIDRIYNQENSQNLNPDTMGHGSTMTFASGANDFTDDQVKELMDCIRIVFFDKGTGEIMARSKLDMTQATKSADGWTAKMFLYEPANNATTTTTYVKVEAGDTYAGPFFKLADDGVTYEQITDENYDGDKYKPNGTTAGTEAFTKKTDNVITALTQNTAKALSVLVYLDGASITNADVAAGGTTSMTGKMNLQFASSANLVPMEYASLHQTSGSGNGGGNGNGDYTVTVPEGVTGNNTAAKNTPYTFTLTENYTLNSVTVDGTALEAGTGYTVSGNTYTIPAEQVTGDIVISVTAPAAGG